MILFFSAHYARKGNLSGTNTYSKVIKIGIVGGLFAYVFVGVLTAIRPGLFSGEDIAFETFQRIRIAFSITVFGLAWFVLSMLRFKRINWEDAIKVKNGETYCSYCMKDDTPTDNTINRKTLLYTFASAITQALIIFAIVISFIRALMSIPITELKEFNFYNLTLAVFFGLISTYITVIIKNEYIGRFPGFSVCKCANSSKKQKQ